MRMMKKIIILFFAFCLAIGANAQFANTSWKGQFNMPDPTQMILQFKTDTLSLNSPDNTPFETMSYKISNDTLTIHKLYGQSECSYDKDATYKIMIKDKKLFATPLSDDCSQRVAVWPSDGLEKIESPNL